MRDERALLWRRLLHMHAMSNDTPRICVLWCILSSMGAIRMHAPICIDRCIPKGAAGSYDRRPGGA